MLSAANSCSSRNGPPVRTTKPGFVVGPIRFGAFQMRGIPLAHRWNWHFQDCLEPLRFSEHFEVGLAVKCVPPVRFRSHCRRLILDVLDLWWDDPNQFRFTQTDYWKSLQPKCNFDELIATSPVLKAAMEAALPDIEVWYVPHAADPRIQADWYNPDGPIVFSGNRAFVQNYRKVISEACRNIGKEILWAHDHHSWQSLQGASLVLAIRLPPYATPLNCIGKPQVKVANAAAAGIPVLCTAAETATTSIWPDLLDVAAPLSAFESAKALVPWLEKALSHAPPKKKFTHEDWLKTMTEIVNA